MTDIVIAAYARSPFTPAKKGDLARVRPDELAAQTVKALVERAHVPVSDIEDLMLGCAFPEGEQGLNVARLIVLMAGRNRSAVSPSTGSAAPPCRRSIAPPGRSRLAPAKSSSARVSRA